MDIIIFGLFGLLGLMLSIIGLWHRDTYYILPAGLIFILLGAVSFGIGINYPAGSSIADVNGTTRVTPIYANFHGGFYADYGLSYLLIFLGLYSFYLPIEWASKRKKAMRSERVYSEEDDE